MAAALQTDPDPTNGIEPARTLKQRNADRLVELAGTALLNEAADHDCEGHEPHGPSGARQNNRPTINVIIDLPTLLGGDFDLDNHRTNDGNVDWDAIQAGFALTGSTPRPVLQQFFCDALTLLCRRHHTSAHQGGWQLTRGPDGRITTTSP